MNIGLGTAAIGRPHYINIKSSPQTSNSFQKEEFIKQGIQTLSAAYKKGIRHFDTAPGYGIAEQILLEWIEKEQPQNISISTKWGYTYVANFQLDAVQHEVKEHSLDKLNEQWKFSSQLLPHVNIYQIHSATFDSGVLDNQEVLNRLFELKHEHKIEIGLSASGEQQNDIIEKALSIEVKGELLFDSFQVTFNIFEQSCLVLNDQLVSSGKKVIVKEALANGRIFLNQQFPNYNRAYALLDQLATKYKVGFDAIAIRFCMDTLQPYSVLSGATEEGQLTANLAALSFELLPVEIAKLKDLAVQPELYWTERKALKWN